MLLIKDFLFNLLHFSIWLYRKVKIQLISSNMIRCVIQKLFIYSFKHGINPLKASPKYRKGTSIRQAPVFRHLRALRKSPWKFITWMNEL